MFGAIVVRRDIKNNIILPMMCVGCEIVVYLCCDIFDDDDDDGSNLPVRCTYIIILVLP